MNTKEVFEKTGRIDREINATFEKLKGLQHGYFENQQNCSHEIVFKYNGNQPGRMFIDGHYFCPACGKTIECSHKNQLFDTEFDKSRVIPLTNLSLFGTARLYSIIRDEVFNNLDLYYSRDVSTDYLASKMEELLIESQCDYGHSTTSFQRVQRPS